MYIYIYTYIYISSRVAHIPSSASPKGRQKPELQPIKLPCTKVCPVKFHAVLW